MTNEIVRRMRNLQRRILDLERAPMPDVIPEEVTEGLYRFVVYAVDWVSSSTAGALLMYSNGKWSRLSSESMHADPVSGPRSVDLFGKQVWISTDAGVHKKSDNLGRLFTDNDTNVTNSENQAHYIDRDASGRLWRIKHVFATDTMTIERSDRTGASWTTIDTFPSFYWFDNGASGFTGAAKAIACHPTNPNIVVATAVDPADDLPKMLITTDGASFSSVALDCPSATEAGHGDVAFHKSGRAMSIYWYRDGSNLRHVLAAYSDSPYSTATSVELDTPPAHSDDNGFTLRMYADESGPLFLAYGRHYAVGATEPGIVVAASSDGATWTVISDSDPPFRVPAGTSFNDYDTYFPGYISGMFYVRESRELWLFFNPYSLAYSEEPGTGLALMCKNPLGGGSWYDMYAKPRGAAGLTVPVFHWATVSGRGDP